MKTIKTEDNAKLVEYLEDGHIRRVTLPLDEDNPQTGIPYGLPFAHILKEGGVCGRVAIQLEDQFHKVGIWTTEDYIQNTKAVKGVFRAVYGRGPAIIQRAIRNWR